MTLFVQLQLRLGQLALVAAVARDESHRQRAEQRGNRVQDHEDQVDDRQALVLLLDSSILRRNEIG